MFGRRPDAVQVRDLAPVRRFMPFVSPRRNESLVYFAHDVEVDRALEFVEDHNRRNPDRPLTLFHLILRAIARVLDERPRLNRFTAGGRVWQRDGIWMTFSAKKAFSDDGAMTTVKLRVEPDWTLDQHLDAMLSGIRVGKGDRRGASDWEMDLLLRLPPFLTRAILWLVRQADEAGLLPRGMLEPDPMHASVFVANLGSVGLDAGYHHLWEYGNCPLFCVIGRIRAGSDGRRVVTLKWSYDERVEDGFYAARSLELLKSLLEKPETL